MPHKKIKEKVKSDYNAISAEFSSSRAGLWTEFDSFLPYYKSNFSVLDLGCGNGRLLDFLGKHGYSSYLGVDFSEKLIEEARRLHPKEKFVVADMAKPPLVGAQKFDAIFAIASFHHLPPSEQVAALGEWKKLLNPGGYLFMTNWNLFQWHFWKSWLKALLWPQYGFFGLQIPWQNKVKRYYYAFTARRLCQHLLTTGFSVILCEKNRNIVIVART